MPPVAQDFRVHWGAAVPGRGKTADRWSAAGLARGWRPPSGYPYRAKIGNSRQLALSGLSSREADHGVHRAAHINRRGVQHREQLSHGWSRTRRARSGSSKPWGCPRGRSPDLPRPGAGDRGGRDVDGPDTRFSPARSRSSATKFIRLDPAIYFNSTICQWRSSRSTSSSPSWRVS